jgi:hypothetical protein
MFFVNSNKVGVWGAKVIDRLAADLKKHFQR